MHERLLMFALLGVVSARRADRRPPPPELASFASVPALVTTFEMREPRVGIHAGAPGRVKKMTPSNAHFSQPL